MKTDPRTLDDIAARWAALGAGFNIAPAPGTPDLEHLLLDTARALPDMARLLPMAATWLRTHSDAVARKRLKRLIDNELEPEHHAALGLLLSASQEGLDRDAFAWLTSKALAPTSEPRPLFSIDRSRGALSRLAERRASDLSRRWGLWCQEFTFKPDALRPASWTYTQHPEIRLRTLFRGDLRASTLAALHHDAGAGRSQRALAAAAGGSRGQVRECIEHLELLGYVTTPMAEHELLPAGPIEPRPIAAVPLNQAA